ncbi:hypothetical protein IMSHALPRED_001406 [Imshaugia aleurites]|uniref:Uncharacterized protein n=1 Tax=Imshaugia aleurites TaxID=172621 RepID=A0A8H3F3H1_9LECA|nr:hypothetical protein IMSHALPRED_001406 [Imshaugia aleurites]
MTAQMTALMDVYGARKTTILNPLTGRNINLPTHVVREAQQITARLRRIIHISDIKKDAYVENEIEMLEIEEIADALISVSDLGSIASNLKA